MVPQGVVKRQHRHVATGLYKGRTGRPATNIQSWLWLCAYVHVFPFRETDQAWGKLQLFSLSGASSELGRQLSVDPKSPGGPGSCSTIAEEAVDQLQENEKLVAEFTETWEEKVRRADSIRQQR